MIQVSTLVAERFSWTVFTPVFNILDIVRVGMVKNYRYIGSIERTKIAAKHYRFFQMVSDIMHFIIKILLEPLCAVGKSTAADPPSKERFYQLY